MASFGFRATESMPSQQKYKFSVMISALIIASNFIQETSSSLPSLHLRGGGDEKTQPTPEQLKRLPWFMVLESSPLRLGPGPYGLPYRAGEPNIRHTLWERDPKKAMSLTLLNLAEDSGPVSQAQKLMRIGADPNFQHPTQEYTPLHAAALRGNTALLKVLVSSGGNLKKRCSFGTPLDVARSRNRTETVEWITEQLKGRR